MDEQSRRGEARCEVDWIWQGGEREAVDGKGATDREQKSKQQEARRQKQKQRPDPKLIGRLHLLLLLSGTRRASRFGQERYLLWQARLLIWSPALIRCRIARTKTK